MTSCSKSFIEKAPQDALVSNQAITNKATLENALNGAYAELRALGCYGRDWPVIGDVQADNEFIESRNAGRYLAQYNYSVTVTDGVVTESWVAAYTAIQRANQVIDASFTDKTATAAEIAAIKAQAYGIRGLVYFKLVNMFAKPYTVDPNSLGVPITLHYTPGATPTRNTVSEVYTQIVNDLKKGFQDGPAYSDGSHLSKYAMEGLLARAYLYMGSNTLAKAAAVDVINNSEFSLVEPEKYGALFANPAVKTDAVEIMFEVDADAIDNLSSDDLGAMFLNGYQDIYASRQLVALYSPTDARRDVLLTGQTTKSGAPNTTIILKYPNTASVDKDNIKVIRLAEVYLIAAEASLPGNEADARGYLNDLMSMRDPAFAGYASTGAQLLSDIVQERRKELAFEGDRFYDMNRLKLPIARSTNGGAIAAGPSNVNLNIPFPDNRRVAPIPQQEIQSNPKIATQQNPGY